MSKPLFRLPYVPLSRQQRVGAKLLMAVQDHIPGCTGGAGDGGPRVHTHLAALRGRLR